MTKTVSFPVSAERVGDEIDVLANLSIPFSDWNIANPSIGGFVTTANTGTLEVLLHLTQGPATRCRHRPARPVRLAVARSPCRAPRFRRSPSLRVSHPVSRLGPGRPK